MTEEIKKKPGRPRSTASKTSDRALSDGEVGGDTRNPNKGARPPRISMNKGQNLSVPEHFFDRNNYYYYWFYEKPTRPGTLDRAKAAYYEHVTDESGNHISRPSGGGTMYLMKLPMKYRLEDLEAKKQKVEKTLYDEASLGDNEYAPTKKDREGGTTSIVERTESDNPYAS